MQSNISENYIYNLIYQGLLMIVPLITVPYLIRTLGIENIGRYSYMQANVGYFILFATLGTTIYAQREIAYIRDKENEKQILFWEIVIVRTITTICAIMLFFIFIRLSDMDNKLYIIQTIDIIAVCFDISWLFIAVEKFRNIVVKNTIMKIINLVLLFTFVRSCEDFKKYILLQSILVIIGNLILWSELRGVIGCLPIKKINIAKHIKSIIKIFIPQIAVQIYLLIDKTMLGIMSSSFEENGYYDQSQKIIKIGLAIATALGSVIMPRITYCYSKNNFDAVKRYMEKAISFTCFLAIPVTFGLIAISPNFILWFLGEGYGSVISLIQIISPVCIFIGINTITGNYLLAIKKDNVYSLSVIVGVIFNVILNYILIPRYQASGAAVASVISEFSVLLIQIIYMQKILPFKLYLYYAIKYSTYAFVMCSIVLVLSKFMGANILNTGILAICGVLIYAVELIVFKDKIFYEIKKKIKLKRKK